MFANPASFGMANRSSGSFDVPRIPTAEASRGSLTSDTELQHEPLAILWPGIAGSIGSMVGMCFRDLLATASVHTFIRSVTLPISVPDERVGVQDRVEPVALRVPAVLDEIEELTGLKKTRIAVHLFGVTKQAYNAWERGLNLSPQNLARVLETRDILVRAAARHPGSANLRAWLQTPRGARAERPRDLLKAGEFGKARLLATSAAPPRERPVADWVLRSTPDPWTSDQLRWHGRSAADDWLPSGADDE
jgi:uncharacterized protein (DUF2384 family)